MGNHITRRSALDISNHKVEYPTLMKNFFNITLPNDRQMIINGPQIILKAGRRFSSLGSKKLFMVRNKWEILSPVLFNIYQHTRLIRRKVRVQAPGQTSKQKKNKKYFSGNFLPVDFWQKL